LLRLTGMGDELAFTRLFELHRDRIYTIALKFTRSNIIAEEIVQDVFLKIWQRRDKLDLIQNFSAYLFAMTRNDVYKVLKEIAGNYKTTLLTDEDSSLAGAYTADLVIAKEYDQVLQNAIDRLPSQQRRVYHLIKDQGLKRGEVADQLQIQPETVKFHLTQAMKNIRAFCTLYLGVFAGLIILLYCMFRNI
jgi:RNA polymerase sigma-70 factor (family 1)